MAELLFWPALLAYGEAAVAFVGEVRKPGAAGRYATWGIRIGWLVQTALLAVQAARADAFPWSTWAASLNLFVWLVVTVYLVWGCQPRYRLLGLAVAPPVAVLFALAHAGGGTDTSGAGSYSTVFLVLHVGLVLAAFAGFTLAAALSALYLWQERRLKRHAAEILCVRAPALARLDELSARTIAFALPALTLGIAVGVVRLRARGGGFDALMAVTLLTWSVYGAYLALRYGAGVRGRRGAYLVLAGFALVVVARLVLPGTHFS
ncbi:MAG TPA: cytochrome c biogenesis protein CcsA [Gaiellaceae bacterium]|nr:cytochrome c biogenesis protein CcsA [Gaiellaceae bacterium]